MVSHHWCAGQSLSASHGITSPSQSTTSEVCDGPPSRQTGMQGTPSTFSLQQTASEAGMWPLVHGGAEAHGSYAEHNEELRRSQNTTDTWHISRLDMRGTMTTSGRRELTSDSATLEGVGAAHDGADHRRVVVVRAAELRVPNPRAHRVLTRLARARHRAGISAGAACRSAGAGGAGVAAAGDGYGVGVAAPLQRHEAHTLHAKKFAVSPFKALPKSSRHLSRHLSRMQRMCKARLIS